MRLPPLPTVRSRRDWFVYAFLLALVVAGTLVVGWLMRATYAVHRLTRGVGDTVFFSADGRPWFRMDEQRQDVPLAAIATPLQQAVVAVEDHRFHRHFGIDPIAFGRAMFRNVREGEIVEGASTLTQQLARTLFLSNRRTWARKLQEGALAVILEAQLSKAQILELYLNRIYVGAGIYGVEPMSRRLFGKPASRLSLAEAALMAGLIRSPSGFSPWSNYDGAVGRSHVVLARMRQERYISADAERAARRVRPAVRPELGPREARAGYAKDYLRQQFRNRFGGDHPPDWKVYTTLVPDLQDAAEHAVANGLARLRKPELQAALVALDVETGNVLAIVGGRDYRLTTFNRAARSRRQPGSAFKPLVFAAALSRGFSPVSRLAGLSNVAIDGPRGVDEWRPQNASDHGGEAGEMTLRQALLESDNRAAAALQQKIGTRPVLALARDTGLRDLPDVASLALGTGLVTPLDLTAAFATFPNGGWAVRPRSIVRVIDAHDEGVLDVGIERGRVLSPEVAFQMVTMLADVVDRGTARAARGMGVRFPAGGKTGTTDDFKDAWFVGFSSSIVAGVWVGFDQPATIAREAYGARVALPIWSEFMKSAARRIPTRGFAAPAGMRDETLCRVSYLRPVQNCPTYTEYFKEGDGVPGRLCPLHKGTLKQQVRRSVEGLLGGLGRKLKGIFRR